MLTITTTQGHNIEWNLGEKIDISTNIVTQVYADGKECYFIYERITNLKMNQSRTHQTWFGDDAKFIVENICKGW